VDEFDISAIVDNDLAVDEVAENAAVGTAVGITAFADDGDATDTVNFWLENDAGGRFTIDAATGIIQVAGPLDFESSASHTITVGASSSDGSAATKVFKVHVLKITEVPGANPDSYSTGEHRNSTPGVSSNDSEEETSQSDDSEGLADPSEIGGFPISESTGDVILQTQTGQPQDLAIFAEETLDDKTTFSETFIYLGESEASEDDCTGLENRYGTDRQRHLRAAHTLTVTSDEGIGQLLHASAFWEDLDGMRDQVNHSTDAGLLVAESALVASTGFTVGYVVWTVRSGLFLTSLLAQVPAWKLVDPLVVLNYSVDKNHSGEVEDDEETLESIISKSQPDAEPREEQQLQ
jgi:hypothetical protein